MEEETKVISEVSVTKVAEEADHKNDSIKVSLSSSLVILQVLSHKFFLKFLFSICFVVELIIIGLPSSNWIFLCNPQIVHTYFHLDSVIVCLWKWYWITRMGDEDWIRWYRKEWCHFAVFSLSLSVCLVWKFSNFKDIVVSIQIDCMRRR